LIYFLNLLSIACLGDYQENWLPQYNWNNVESGIKYHNTNPINLKNILTTSWKFFSNWFKYTSGFSWSFASFLWIKLNSPLKIKISFYKIYVTRYDYNLTIMKLQILKNFYRLPFSKWPPQYRTNSTLSDFNDISYVGR
jgi:hypothetical protein